MGGMSKWTHGDIAFKESLPSSNSQGRFVLQNPPYDSSTIKNKNKKKLKEITILLDA